MLVVTARQIMRSGARSVTLESVSKEAGCSKGLVTYHFGNRDRMLAGASSEIFATRRTEWSAVLRSSVDGAVEGTFRLLINEGQTGFWRAWTTLWAENGEETVQAVNNHWTSFADTVVLAVEDLLAVSGLESTVESGELGRLLAAGLQGLGLQLATGVPVHLIESSHAALWAAALALTRPAPPSAA